MSILMTNKQVATFIKKSQGNSPLLRLEKFPFIAIDNWIVSAVQKSVKCYFAPNSQSYRNSGGEKNKKRRNCEALYFSSKRKNKCKNVTWTFLL